MLHSTLITKGDWGHFKEPERGANHCDIFGNQEKSREIKEISRNHRNQ